MGKPVKVKLRPPVKWHGGKHYLAEWNLILPILPLVVGRKLG